MNQYKSKPRRLLADVSILGTTQLHLRNPFVIAVWSIIFPGFGHILLAKYLRGFFLFLWEVIINYKAHINLLILYSFTGDFEKAKEVANIQWLYFYVPTYIFAIWDSYRTTVDLNHQYLLASREDAKITPFIINPVGVNYLDKRKPWVASVWSLLAPGSGQFYLHKLIASFIVIICWIILSYNSKMLPSVHYTLLGDFEQAKAVIDMHWFLNVPSIYLFSMYDAYVNAVEYNKLFERELSQFLKLEYQSPEFYMPFKKHAKGDKMYVVSIFEHSKYLELVITSLLMKGVAKENILAIPMDENNDDRKLFDSIHGSDGLSLLDLTAILASFLGIFGCVYGFILTWGPLIWGLIGIITGGLIGLLIKLALNKKNTGKREKNHKVETVLIIECSESQQEMIKDTLREHYAIGVKKLDLNNR